MLRRLDAILFVPFDLRVGCCSFFMVLWIPHFAFVPHFLLCCTVASFDYFLVGTSASAAPIPWGSRYFQVHADAFLVA